MSPTDVSQVTRSVQWEALRQATEALYEAFAAYPLRDIIDGCSHCVDAEDNARLHSKPLRELSDDDLYTFLFNNVSETWGDALDFKHFLPRLFELVSLQVAGRHCYLDMEQLGIGVLRHGYATWPEHERSALDAFALAWWRATLSVYPRGRPGAFMHPDGYQDAESVLSTIGQYTEDVELYLTVWLQSRTLTGLGHLVEVMLGHADCSFMRYASWGHYAQHQQGQLVRWLHGRHTFVYALALADNARMLDPETYTAYLDQSYYRRLLSEAIGWMARWAVESV